MHAPPPRGSESQTSETECARWSWRSLSPPGCGRGNSVTGPHTFSAAGEFADAVKSFGLATIVGEETGGQPNAFGNQLPLRLPRSGLSVDIATNRAVRASGSLTDNIGVTPDIVVRTTAADIQALADPVLERAKSCPDRSIQ